MAGVQSDGTYEPIEIRGLATDDYVVVPCIIEEGQDLAVGTVIGIRPTTGKYVAYDDDAAASATSAAAGEGNSGDGICSAVAVLDGYTLTENWTLTCTQASSNGGTFSVVGSVTGAAGNATVGVEFKYPNTASYKVKFTISDGNGDFVQGDTFTFSTTAAEARTALGILAEDVDATDGDVISSMYTKGNFVESLLTGLDSAGKTDLNGRSAGDLFYM